MNLWKLQKLKLLLFLNYWLVTFNSCSYYRNFIVIAKPALPTEIPTKKTREQIKTYPLPADAKISKSSV